MFAMIAKLIYVLYVRQNIIDLIKYLIMSQKNIFVKFMEKK